MIDAPSRSHMYETVKGKLTRLMAGIGLAPRQHLDITPADLVELRKWAFDATEGIGVAIAAHGDQPARFEPWTFNARMRRADDLVAWAMRPLVPDKTEEGNEQV
jgi:hypothetical protein